MVCTAEDAFSHLHPNLQAHLRTKLGFKRPTGIQQVAIPKISCASLNKDIVLQSQTGSGKTLAYAVPIVQQLLSIPNELQKKLDRSIGTLAVVIVPTRELARQIHDILTSLLNMSLSSSDNGEAKLKHWIVPGLLIGGEKRKAEKSRLRKGVTVLIATPGRLLDHLQSTKSFVADQCRWLVLDEADKLLELGFENKILEILDLLRKSSVLTKTTAPSYRVLTDAWPNSLRIVMCSATMHSRLKKLADFNLKTPMYLQSTECSGSGASSGSVVTVSQHLRQHYCLVPAKQRLVYLIALVKYISDHFPNSKCIVFFSCIDSVEFHHLALTNRLSEASLDKSSKNASEGLNDPSGAVNATQGEVDVAGLPVHFFRTPIMALHGSLDPQVRHQTFKKFSASSGGILLTTDVSSRGIDLPNVDFVIQCDAPNEVNAYVHRIGRTARVDAPGVAITMLLPEETQYVALLRDKGLELSELRGALEQSQGTLGMTSPLDIGPKQVHEQMGNVLKHSVARDALEYLITHTPSIAYGFRYLDKYSDPNVPPSPPLLSGRVIDYEVLATDIQMRVERLVEFSNSSLDTDEEDTDKSSKSDLGVLARKSFLSHIRAYATHPADERHIFHVKRLHLGHLAKSFALRETPTQIRDWQSTAGSESHNATKNHEDSVASSKKRKIGKTIRPEDRFFRAAKMKTTKFQMADEFASGAINETASFNSSDSRKGKFTRKFRSKR